MFGVIAQLHNFQKACAFAGHTFNFTFYPLQHSKSLLRISLSEETDAHWQTGETPGKLLETRLL